MARFDTTGLDELIKDMQSIGQRMDGDLAQQMLVAGAECVKQAWKQSAQQHDLRDTGDMIESIDFARQAKMLGQIRYIDIYPQGKDRHGVRNAEKAFILHYGTKRIAATHWVDDADRLCDTTVIAAMRAVFQAKTKGR